MEEEQDKTTSELLLRTMAEEEGEDEGKEGDGGEFPDWQLIDEISIRLLEQGIGIFETLQRALPSVALAQIEEIQTDLAEEGAEGKRERCCTASRMLKLFRLAQLQIDYLLKSQQEMVERVNKAEERAKRARRENRALREQFCRGPPGDPEAAEVPEGAQWGRELFRCNECTKIFLHANFLSEHIQRRHGGHLESAARLSSVTRAGRVLGLGDDSSGPKQDKEEGERAMRSVKRKGAPQRGQSHGSGTFRKRNDGRSATAAFILPRQQSQTKQKHWREEEHKSSCPSSSIGKDGVAINPLGPSAAGGRERRTTLALSGEEGERSSQSGGGGMWS